MPSAGPPPGERVHARGVGRSGRLERVTGVDDPIAVIEVQLDRRVGKHLDPRRRPRRRSRRCRSCRRSRRCTDVAPNSEVCSHRYADRGHEIANRQASDRDGPRAGDHGGGARVCWPCRSRSLPLCRRSPRAPCRPDRRHAGEAVPLPSCLRPALVGAGDHRIVNADVARHRDLRSVVERMPRRGSACCRWPSSGRWHCRVSGEAVLGDEVARGNGVRRDAQALAGGLPRRRRCFVLDEVVLEDVVGAGIQ